MTLLPIVVRELRVAARRKSTYSERFKLAVIAVATGAVLLIVLNSSPYAVTQAGLEVFTVMATAGFFLCLAMSSNTADCVSEENREGTLGLLFLTDLSGWDVVLGKLCANSIKSFYALLATFPVVAFVLLLGGVGIGQFCKVALALVNTFLFAHAAGLMASVMSRARAGAHWATAALLLGFLAGPLLPGLAVHKGLFTQFSELLAALSPGYAFTCAMDPATGGSYYWVSLILVCLESWLLLALASSRVPRCWQEQAGAARLRWRDRFRQWTYGPPGFRAGLRRKLIGVNPFLWLVSRNRLFPIIFWSCAAAYGGLWIWALCETYRQDRIPLLASFVVWNHLLLLGGVAAQAGKHLEEQRRSGALEFVLCSTPLQVEEILAGQWQLLRRRCLRPLIIVLAVDLAAMLLSRSRLVDDDSNGQFAWFVAGVMVMLAVDAVAAGWVGMWRGMTQRLGRKTSGGGSATIETVGLLVFAPMMGLYIIPLTFLLLGQEYFLDRYFSSFGPVFGVWFLFSLTAAIGYGNHARKKLLTRFREMAAVQSAERIGILGRLGRLLGKVFRRRAQRPLRTREKIT
jgi:hypothetical protein